MTGPLGDPVDAVWAVLPDGTAVIEMSSASGLALVRNRNDPLRATTRGTGELIAAAARGGARRILVAVGGSATTDGGLAAVEALGWSLAGLDVTVACDVSTAVRRRRARLRPAEGRDRARRSRCSRDDSNSSPVRSAIAPASTSTELEGGGAAGGLAGGLAAIGADARAGLRRRRARSPASRPRSKASSLVVTGEGKLDATSFEGKVVGGVLEWAADQGVPHARGDRGSGHRRRARGAVGPRPTSQVLALTDRVWQAGGGVRRATLSRRPRSRTAADRGRAADLRWRPSRRSRCERRSGEERLHRERLLVREPLDVGERGRDVEAGDGLWLEAGDERGRAVVVDALVEPDREHPGPRVLVPAAARRGMRRPERLELGVLAGRGRAPSRSAGS